MEVVDDQGADNGRRVVVRVPSTTGRSRPLSWVYSVEEWICQGRHRNPFFNLGIKSHAIAPQNPRSELGRLLQYAWSAEAYLSANDGDK